MDQSLRVHATIPPVEELRLQRSGPEGARAVSVPEFGWKTPEPPISMSYVVPQVERLCPPLGPSVRVLDVGCGNGYLAGWFSKKGCKVVGIDLSEDGIAMARRTYPDARFELQAASSGLLRRLGEAPFDLVVSTEVVEHLYAPREWATGCFEALRPGGRLICSTPYHGFLKNLILSLGNGWDRHLNPLQDGGHIKFWSKRTLSALLLESGFEHLRFRGAGRVPLVSMSMVMSADRRSAA